MRRSLLYLMLYPESARPDSSPVPAACSTASDHVAGASQVKPVPAGAKPEWGPLVIDDDDTGGGGGMGTGALAGIGAGVGALVAVLATAFFVLRRYFHQVRSPPCVQGSHSIDKLAPSDL